MIHPEKNDSPPPPDPGGSSIDFASLALSGLGLLMLLASLNPHWGLWGIDYLAAFPIWLRVALWCTLLIFSIPHFSKKTAKLLSRAFVSVGERLTALLYFTLAAGLVALFMRFSSQNHLLGDGFIIQSTIAEGMRFSPTEPLEYFVHHLVYTAIGGDKGAYLSYALLSYLMGAVFLLILFRFFKGGPRPFLALAAALSFGAMLFFFGYVENYTISFVMAFVYMLSGWKDYETGRVSPLTIGSLVLAIGFHLNGMVFLPSFAVLLWRKHGSRRLLVLSGVAIVILALAGFAYLDKYTTLRLREIFVPFLPTLKNPYCLLCLSHLKDLVNILLLDFPLLLLIPVLARGSKIESTLFFASAIIPTLLFTILIDPRIGAARDWDLPSLATAPILVCLLAILSDRYDREPVSVLALIPPLFLFALLHTGSWVYHNTDRQGSYAWMKEIIRQDIHYSKDYFGGYRNKSWSIIAKLNYADLAEATRACEYPAIGRPRGRRKHCPTGRKLHGQGRHVQSRGRNPVFPP